MELSRIVFLDSKSTVGHLFSVGFEVNKGLTRYAEDLSCHAAFRVSDIQDLDKGHTSCCH